MTLKKLARIKIELRSYRHSQVNGQKLRSLAQRLGRTKENRGKEPTFINLEFLDLPPLAIPHHGGRDLPIGTKTSILNVLEEDILRWELSLNE
jgi:hypothetical protein